MSLCEPLLQVVHLCPYVYTSVTLCTYMSLTNDSLLEDGLILTVLEKIKFIKKSIFSSRKFLLYWRCKGLVTRPRDWSHSFYDRWVLEGAEGLFVVLYFRAKEYPRTKLCTLGTFLSLYICHYMYISITWCISLSLSVHPCHYVYISVTMYTYMSLCEHLCHYVYIHVPL